MHVLHGAGGRFQSDRDLLASQDIAVTLGEKVIRATWGAGGHDKCVWWRRLNVAGGDPKRRDDQQCRQNDYEEQILDRVFVEAHAPAVVLVRDGANSIAALASWVRWRWSGGPKQCVTKIGECAV